MWKSGGYRRELVHVLNDQEKSLSVLYFNNLVFPLFQQQNAKDPGQTTCALVVRIIFSHFLLSFKSYLLNIYGIDKYSLQKWK